jgi:hypothetical protein
MMNTSKIRFIRDGKTCSNKPIVILENLKEISYGSRA